MGAGMQKSNSTESIRDKVVGKGCGHHTKGRGRDKNKTLWRTTRAVELFFRQEARYRSPAPGRYTGPDRKLAHLILYPLDMDWGSRPCPHIVLLSGFGCSPYFSDNMLTGD
jgi:hypothetical protein